MLDVLLLVLALCTDTFVASISYGANGVEIHKKEVLVINLICSACLGGALWIGHVLDSLAPENLTQAICFISLCLLGAVKLLDYSVKRYINKHCTLHKDFQFTFSQLYFIISIYGNPMAADQDHSNSLSSKEAVFLALAMSLDSFVAGTLAAFMKIHAGLAMLGLFFVGVLAVYAGLWLGRKVALKSKWDVSWMSGVLLILLAFMKLI